MKQILLLAHKNISKKLNTSKPTSGGNKWTAEEDIQLKEEYESHISIKEIAQIHERSTGAINSRIIKLYPEMLNLISNEDT